MILVVALSDTKRSFSSTQVIFRASFVLWCREFCQSYRSSQSNQDSHQFIGFTNSLFHIRKIKCFGPKNLKLSYFTLYLFCLLYLTLSSYFNTKSISNSYAIKLCILEICQKFQKLLSNSFAFDLCILANLAFDGPKIGIFA